MIAILFIAYLGKKIIRRWQKSDTSEKQRLFPLLLAGISIIILGLFDHYFLTLQQGQLVLSVVLGFLFAV